MAKKLFIFGCFSSVLVLVTCLLAILFKTSIFHYFVSKNAHLVPGTFVYDKWLNLPIELKTNFYLFDLLNPNEVRNGSLPQLKEIGPFVYREIRTRENVTFNGNGTLTYNERRKFYFMPELSIASDNLTVTSINMVVITAINLIQNNPILNNDLIKIIVDMFLLSEKETLFVTKPVKQLLFGYEDQLLTFLANLKIVPNGNISFFYNKNNTIDGEYTIYDGVTDVNKLGDIENYNGLNTLSIWASEFANKLNGTDSTINFPFMNKSSIPYTYQVDSCRSFHSVFNESIKTFHNIELYGYILDEYFWANATVNPSNEGFCIPNCLVSGIFNLSKCARSGNIDLPIYLSMPHYLFGDKKLIDDCIGLKPNFTEHRTIVYFEPLTGITMKANKRVQLNTKLVRDKNIPMVKHLQEIYFPLFWLDENFEIDQNLSDKFYHMVTLPILLFDIFVYVLIGIGALVGAFTIFFKCFRPNRRLRVYAYEPIGSDDVDYSEPNNINNSDQIINNDESNETNALLI